MVLQVPIDAAVRAWGALERSILSLLSLLPLQDGELKEHADADRNADLRLKKVWNMLLVKPKQRNDPKYKFSFELISPSGEIDVFQAETDEAMMHWLQVRLGRFSD